MVITSSTQWTIPLSSSSIAASSPSLTKHGSVLGLKTCQLSAPPLAIAGELHDLHSTSSRRLLGAPDASHRRSAGSFRQLVNEDFCAKTHDFACIDSPEWLSGKEYDAPHDGIAMPWSSSSLHPNNFDSSTLGFPTFNSINSSVDYFHGEITAEDVDLLPMPGMLSCPSPFYAESYMSHAHSPKSSKIRSTEVSSPESSANSCKSSVMLPNHLGLPQNFNAEVDHTMNVPVAPPPVDTEHVRGGSNHLPFAAGTHVYGKDTDNFNELLAGLWTSSAVNCNTDHMLDDSESLASIFNVFPQKFHGLSASGESTDQSDNIACDNGLSQLAVHDLHHLVNSIAEARNANAKVSGSFHDLTATKGYKVAENRGSIMWEATQQSEYCIAMPHSNAGKPKSAHLLDTSAMLSESSLGGSMDSASSLEKKCEPVPISGMKRPFSMLQLAGIASSMPSTAGIACANAWHPSLGLPMPVKDEEVSHNFSTMLYKSQKDPKLAGFYYHMAKEQAKMEEEMQPQPSPAKVRRKHGTAMDPQSVAARSRREKFSERIRILQSLVPNGERLDTVSMLGQTFEYVRYLQHQVWQLYHGKDLASPNNTCEKWKDFVEAERGSANLA